jgi:hypothetical protein
MRYSKGSSVIIALLFTMASLNGQELYVFTEPASNMPARSISARFSARFLNEPGKLQQRYAPEIMWGINNRWMVHAATSFSNMYGTPMRWESAWLYAKYRFLSVDEVHRHFRAAVFGEVSKSVNDFMFHEMALNGDNSGAQAGLIATQLINKLAVSGTVSYLSLFNRGKSQVIPSGSYNYSVSAGYLLLPRQYRSFNQTNLNLYLEVLGQNTSGTNGRFLDLAPAVQLIFNSNSKLNLGYRFQLFGNMHRMAEQSWLLSFETTFLNVFRKK